MSRNVLICAWDLAMPAHSHTTNARDFEPTPIHFEPIAVLFEAKTFEAVRALETGIAGRVFPGFHAAKEGLERFIEIANNGLQHMTVDRSSIGIGSFVGLHLAKLFILADSALLPARRPLCALPDTGCTSGDTFPTSYEGRVADFWRDRDGRRWR